MRTYGMCMSTSADAGEPPAAASLHKNAAKILMYLSTQESERASTPTLRDATGLSAANISGHHALTLIEKGYIEKTGKEAGDAPKDANVYTLTHRGRKEAKRLLKRNEAPMGEMEKVQYIRQLQNRVDELEEKVGEHDTTIGKLDSRFERLAKIVKSLRA